MTGKSSQLWPDDVLITLIKEGDRDAFAIIYNKYWQKLYLSAFNLLRDGQACEDIVQDVLVKLWLKRDSVLINNLASYLHTAVRYQVFTFIRLGKARHFSVEEVDEPLATDNLDDLLIEKDLRYHLNERVLSLPEKCREIFLLSRNHQLSNKEIAALLNIAPKTVENQLTIALKRLKLSMKELLCWFLLFFSIINR